MADGCPSTPLAMVVRLDAGNGQLVGDGGQFGCRPWSVSLAKLVNCCGAGGQVAGVLQLFLKTTLTQWMGMSNIACVATCRLSLSTDMRHNQTKR